MADDGPDVTASLAGEVARLREENARLHSELEQLRRRIAELEAKLERSSANSSAPPSSDSMGKAAAARMSRAERRRAARAATKAEARRRGKQPGAEGKNLAMREDPDVVVVRAPAWCSNCGGDLSGAFVESIKRRQVFDIPDPKMTCTEHQSVRKRCSCGVLTAGGFPPEARAPVSYGPNIRANGLYLLHDQHVPVERTQEALSSMLGVSVSAGFLSSLVPQAAAELERAGYMDVLKARLKNEAVIHVDETPDQVGTKTWYFHVAASKRFTYLFASPTRAKSAPDEAGVLPGFRGVMVHDRLKMYFHRDYAKAKHAICLAHIVRDLDGVAAVLSQQPWAKPMKELMLEMNAACYAAREAGRRRLGRRQLQGFMARYDALVAAGLAANPTPPAGRSRDYLERKSYNLASALRDLRGEATLFAKDLRVPFSNNDGEQPIRMVKLHKLWAEPGYGSSSSGDVHLTWSGWVWPVVGAA